MVCLKFSKTSCVNEVLDHYDDDDDSCGGWLGGGGDCQKELKRQVFKQKNNKQINKQI